MTPANRAAAGLGKPLRRDAERNRQLILDAAGDVFAERGLEASFDEIARRAGVGVGTVYRRFPDREDLVDALFTQRISAVVAVAEQAHAIADPWDALVWFTETSLRMQAADRGLKQVLVQSGRGHERLAVAQERLIPAVGRILLRARESGGLRHDVEVFDLAAITSLLSTVSTPSEPELWRRYVVLLLDGLRESRTAPTPLPLAAPEQLDLAEIARSAGGGPVGASGLGGTS